MNLFDTKYNDSTFRFTIVHVIWFQIIAAVAVPLTFNIAFSQPTTVVAEVVL